MAPDFDQYTDLIPTLVPISGLAPAYQKELLSKARVREIRKGQFAFRQGDQDGFSFYLLRGDLALLTEDRLLKRVSAGTDAARYALAQLQPRQMSARAETDAVVLVADRLLLDRLLTLDEAGSHADKMRVSDPEGEDTGDWMTRMLQSDLFARIPAVNLQRIFTAMESVNLHGGDVVVRQGEPGDYYYIIQRGRCTVTRRPGAEGQEVKLAELGPGDSFGEEALVSDTTRNATITMTTDGQLMRLTKADFIELIKKPTLQAVSYEEAQNRVARGSVWLDVRFAEERESGQIEGSLNIPLNLLRMQVGRLDRNKHYIVYCDTGSRSSVGAFLLNQRGLDAVVLSGGFLATPLARETAGEASAPAPTPPAAAEAPSPAAPPSPAEKPADGADLSAGVADAAVAALRERVEVLSGQLEQAVQQRLEVEKARQTLQAYFVRLRQEYTQVKAARETAEQRLQSLSGESARQAAERTALERDKAALEQQLRDLRERQAAAAGGEEAALAQARAEADRAQAAHRQALEDAATRIGALQEQLEQARKDGDRARQELDRSAAQHQQGEAESAAQVSELQARLARAEAEALGARQEAQRVQEEQTLLRHASHQAAAERQREIQDLLQRAINAEEALAAGQAGAAADLAEHQQALEALRSQSELTQQASERTRAELEAALADARAETAQARQHADGLAQELETANTRLASAAARLGEQTEALEAAQRLQADREAQAMEERAWVEAELQTARQALADARAASVAAAEQHAAELERLRREALDGAAAQLAEERAALAGEAERRLAEREQERLRAEAALADLQARYQRAEEARREAEERLERVVAQHRSDLENALADLRGRYESAEAARREAEARIERLLAQHRADLDETRAELNARLEAAEAARRDAEERLARSAAEQASLEAARVDWRDRYEAAEASRRETEERLAAQYRVQVEETRRAGDLELAQERRRLREELSRLDAVMAEAQHMREEAEAMRREAEAQAHPPAQTPAPAARAGGREGGDEQIMPRDQIDALRRQAEALRRQREQMERKSK